MSHVPFVTAQELKQELESPNPPLLIDVRESDELEISRLPGIIHIPLSEFENRISEIDPEANSVIVCRTGGRSARVTAMLITRGYPNVRNFAGGMNGWARDIDPTVATY